MFPIVEAFGKPIDREYAETRAKWERLYEATQTKGDGEAHPFLSPNDEFANFESWDKGNLDGSVAKTKDMLEFEYARSALKNGLKLEAAARHQSVQVRPDRQQRRPHRPGRDGGRQFLRQDHAAGTQPGAHDATFFDNPKTGVKIMDWEVSASGYAAVWATENTREAILDAMERRETYATTGPRMIVRFFGGWDFEAEDAQQPPARPPIGYSKGVPMGGDLRDGAAGQGADVPGRGARRTRSARTSTASRSSRAGSTPRAKLQEKVYDVVWGDADKRKPGADGKLPPVGSTVDVANATWTNTIGDPELITVWKDPDFDADAARLLLRARDRDPDAALDRLRRQALRRQAAARDRDDAAGARLHLADLVHAGRLIEVNARLREELCEST